MVERIEIPGENLKDDDELEMLLGEIPHVTSSLTHHHNHNHNHNHHGYGNGNVYGMYDDDKSCSYKQNTHIFPASSSFVESNGQFSSFFSKDDDIDHTPKPHMLSRSYSSILPYSCFAKKFDENLFSESGNDRTNRNSVTRVQSQLNSEMSPFLGFSQPHGFNGMQIPLGRADNLFPQSNLNRNVLNFRYPVSLYQRRIPALDLAVCNGLHRVRQNGMLLMDQRGVSVQPNLHNVPFKGLEGSEDGLIIQGESVKLNHARNKVTGAFKGQNKKCSFTENGRIVMSNRSFSTPIRCNTLFDAQGYIYMLAKDQNGCRYLQSVFDEGNQGHVEMVFDEIVGHVAELMVNPFGNYLMQKLLEVCNEEQRMQILTEVTREPRELVQISLNTHGTRVVQKLIETLKTIHQIKMVISALEPGFLALIKDLNGNHVIQRCLQCLSNEDNKFIFEAAAKFCVDIATHQHGCCVLQRCINHSTGKHQENLVLEISSNGLLLAQDAFGNYVVQSILELQIPSAVSILISQFEGNYVHLATQKFSSHVVEKCLLVLDDHARSTIIRELVSATQFEQLLQDPHANYVVQTALRVAEGSLHNSLVKAIESHKAISRNSPYSKRIFSHKLLKK